MSSPQQLSFAIHTCCAALRFYYIMLWNTYNIINRVDRSTTAQFYKDPTLRKFQMSTGKYSIVTF